MRLNEPLSAQSSILSPALPNESLPIIAVTSTLDTDLPPEPSGKDLSFLKEPSLYHPLSQLEIPLPFRVNLPIIAPGESLSVSLAKLDGLLSKSQFLAAGHLSALLLTSENVRPTDTSTMFRLLQIRYSCLELTGNSLLAAQESKALEDLNSAFYFTGTTVETPLDGERMEAHIMPYSLRLQALRLQSIGFGDPRRGISSLYDLGLECREQIALPSTPKQERDLWRKRLQELGIRVVNALIEMGDLDTAKRTLEGYISSETAKTAASSENRSVNSEMIASMALLLLKIGDTTSARKLVKKHRDTDLDFNILPALLSIAEGRWNDAVNDWTALLQKSPPGPSHLEVTIRQNLAVSLLYIGRLREARETLETLITPHPTKDSQLQPQGFPTLTFNLATLYELSSSNPLPSKRDLAERVAQQVQDSGGVGGGSSHGVGVARTNADFKL